MRSKIGTKVSNVPLYLLSKDWWISVGLSVGILSGLMKLRSRWWTLEGDTELYICITIQTTTFTKKHSVIHIIRSFFVVN